MTDNNNHNSTPVHEIVRREGGKRIKSMPVRRLEQDRPLITVVTIVYNDREGLRKTIESVLGQTYQNIEYIIIDGASTDGTLDILEKYDDSIDYWISEPDKGIYDAMNKGIRHASGEWINFMNASDRFYRPDVLGSLFNQGYITADLIYGHHECRYSRSLSVIKQAYSEQELVHLWQGMPFRHQTLFMKTSILKERPLDTTFQVGADFESIYHAYRHGHTFKNSNIVIATITAIGYSHKHLLLGNLELWKLNRKCRPSSEVDLFFARKHLTTLMKLIVKALLPNELLERFLRLKHQM